MRILVTGAKGFVGKNLCAQLNNIKEGKARWYNLPEPIEAIYEYDIDSTPEQLDEWCKECTFVFNLAGVNRPKDPKEFMEGNFGFASVLLDTLKKYENKAPVMLSSSAQASLTGRFGNSEYGRSKKAGEDLFLKYGEENGVKMLVYRFPNLFGKWCRPNYNSAVATFCNNIANDLPITVNDPSVELELLYIDDLVEEMILALKGQEHRCEFNGLEVIPMNGSNTDSTDSTDNTDESKSVESEKSVFENKIGRYCYCPITHHATLGEIVDIIQECAASVNPAEGQVQMAMEVPQGSLRYKLMTTYLSYLPQQKAVIDLKMNIDQRGSFTELIHTLNCGQVSINISKPGITKGQHWHHSKWETFIVVSGHGLIQLRKEGTNACGEPVESKVWNYEVSGEKIQAVHMLPGYTHNIINLSETEDLVTVMYCNEIFNPDRPDTFFDPVVPEGK